VIFISIDDGEFDNLRKLCNEIFGEENFVGCIVWHKKYAPANDTVDLSASHDFILVFAKSRPVSNGGRVDALLSKLSRTDEQNRVYKNPDGDPRGPWRADNYTCNKSAEERPNLYYAITNPNTGEEIWPSKTRVWGYGKDVHLQHVIDNRIWWGLDGSNKVPAYKRFLSEVGGIIADTWWDWRDVGHNDEAKKEFLELLPELSRSFETPKPTRLIRRMVQLATQVDAGDIVLDFFAGSGSTGDAVLMLNEHDGGDRRFVLVQLPEPTDRANFGTIADITKQRVRRVIERLTGKEGGRSNTGDERSLDRGFRVFKLAESNFKPWDAESPKDVATLTTQLGLHVDHIRDGRTAQDLLFEVLLKTGFPLTTPVEDLVLADKTVHSVAGGALLVCLDRQLTVELVRAIADKKPERVVCLDAGFAGNDQLKANAAQIFRSEGITSFKTV
jgi:adenine-specific DNA-methyltransferase